MLNKIQKINSNGKNKENDSELSVFNMMSASNMADVLSGMTTGMDIYKIDLDKLKDSPPDWNFYSPLSERKMNELIDSIEKNGLLHPLVVWEQEDKTYLILSGHNRRRAYQKLLEETKDEKYKQIYCFVKKKDDISEDEAKEIIIDTNWIQRELSTIEKAQSIFRKYTAMGRKQKVKDGEGTGTRNYDIIATQYQISGRHVMNYYKLNFLIEELQEMIQNNSISIKAGVKLADLHPLTQKWLYDNYKDKIDSKLATKLDKTMTNEDVQNVILSNDSNDLIEVKFNIPVKLKEEFEEYVQSFYSKYDLD